MDTAQVTHLFPHLKPIEDWVDSEKWGRYSQLFVDAHQEATDKPGAWKWTAYRLLAGAGMLVTCVGGVAAFGYSLYMITAPELFKPTRLAVWLSDSTRVRIAGGFGTVASFAVLLAGVSYLNNLVDHYSDPYDGLKHRDEDHDSYRVRLTRPESYVWNRLLYFNYDAFRKDLHPLKRLVRYDRMTPAEYGTARVLTTVITDWLSELDRTEASQIERVLLSVSRPEHDTLLHALDSTNATHIKTIHEAYRQALLLDPTKNRYFIYQHNLCLFIPPLEPHIILYHC